MGGAGRPYEGVTAAVLRSAQGEGDLGERMARAVRRVTVESAQPVLLMGSDCPALRNGCEGKGNGLVDRVP